MFDIILTSIIAIVLVVVSVVFVVFGPGHFVKALHRPLNYKKRNRRRR